MTQCELSVVMPCLNEAETLAVCIRKAADCMERAAIDGEVIVADNGSTDGSQGIARGLGARVVHVQEKGYGAALLGGIASARGRYVIMGDSDDSYDFAKLEPFVDKLRQGYDLVMGNRFLGGIAPGAMPTLHRYLGNPVLTGIGRFLFRSPSGDFHCGLRGFSKQAIDDLQLRTTGMEFASEMVVKATLNKLKIAEVPTTLSPDGRSRAPHLRSWRDGWRHLRFLLMHNPRWLFLVPGMVMVGVALIVFALLLPGPLVLGSVCFDVHSLVVAAGVLLVGTQLVSFAVLARKHGANQGFLPRDAAAGSWMTVERGVMTGLLLVALGGGALLYAVIVWGRHGFGDLDYTKTMRLVVPAVTGMALGVQLAIFGFMSSILDLGETLD